MYISNRNCYRLFVKKEEEERARKEAEERARQEEEERRKQEKERLRREQEERRKVEFVSTELNQITAVQSL